MTFLIERGLARLFAAAVSIGMATIAVAAEAPPIRHVPDNLYGIDFVDSDHGWATGYYGTVLRTQDGGKTWVHGSIGAPELVRRVDFVDRDRGWAVGHRGSVFYSIDGGASWTVQYRQPGTNLRDVKFIDNKTGWVVGHEGLILATTDGGKTWERQQLSDYRGRDLPRLNSVAAWNRDRAILVGEFGTIAETADGGKHWNMVENETKTTINAVAALGKDSAIAVGLNGEAIVVHSDAKSERLETGTTEHLFAVAVDSTGTAFACGQAILLRIAAGKAEAVAAAPDVNLDFSWFGGIATNPNGGIWAAGKSGSIIRLDLASRKFVLQSW